MATIEEKEPGLGLIAGWAEIFGAPEEAFRLLITILFGYPIATVYRCFVEQQSKTLQHIFFSLCGFSLCIFNYGFDTYHSLIAIWITYLLVRLLQKSPHQLVIINFVFHMAYLLIGYYFTSSNNYDILWTMPHCVLVLRMIGFGFDVADGQKQREKLSKEQLETAIVELPSLLELMAFGYFPISFLVGPQFPYRRYLRFINGEFRPYTGSIKAGVQRLLQGLLYLSIRQIGAMYLPDDYFLTDAYQNQPFIWRLIYLGIWGKHSIYKYISCWLLVEGGLMIIGISYAGKKPDGQPDWSGCCNVKLILLETGNPMSHYIQSFNINTNQWVAQYIYKRLKFLNNRTISYAAALTFLAVWHGFHSGYYLTFLLEYLTVTVEKQIETFYEKDVLPKYGSILNASLPYKCLEFIVLKSYNIIYIAWCLVPFIYLKYSRYIRIMGALHYFGFVFIGGWLMFHQYYKFRVRANRAKESGKQTTLSNKINDSKED